MNLLNWLAYIETFHPKTIDLGLERVAVVAQHMNLLPFNCPVITVTGTNGKGSCVALLENVFSALGYQVGSYTSPHLISYNERVRINKQIVADDLLCQSFALVEEKRGATSLTYFEFGTLAALQIFKQANLDVIILEIGMGGRLDAVNIVDADIAIISTIALDHTEWLGNDREQIGYEKAGIFRANKYAICGDVAVPNSVRKYAQDVGAKLYCLQEDFAYQQSQEKNWSWWSKQQRLDNLPLPKIELQNAATILMALELFFTHLMPIISLDKRRAVIAAGLNAVFLPGRFQIFADAIPTIIDVAHNPAAAAWLANKLRATANEGRTLAVIAMLADKDQAATVSYLLDQIAVWHVAGLTVPRGDKATVLADCLRASGALLVYEHTDVVGAYKAALTQAVAGDRIVVFGSFYTVAEVLRLKRYQI